MYQSDIRIITELVLSVLKIFYPIKPFTLDFLGFENVFIVCGHHILYYFFQFVFLLNENGEYYNALVRRQPTFIPVRYFGNIYPTYN